MDVLAILGCLQHIINNVLDASGFDAASVFFDDTTAEGTTASSNSSGRLCPELYKQ